MNKKRIRNFIKLIMGVMIISIIAFIIFVRNFYGFDWTDESFYLSIADRFFKGGIPIEKEWNPAQLFGIVILPIYSAYIKIMGSSDYIYLFFRMYFLFLAYITSIGIYVLIKKIGYSYSVATICSIIFLLYSRASIPSLSYYSMSLITYSIPCFIIFYLNYFKVESKKINFSLSFIIGFLLVIAICSNPFIIIIYIIGFISSVVMARKDSIWFCRIVGGLIGSGTLAIIITLFLFSRTSISHIFKNIKFIISDPEHESRNFLIEILRWFNNILKEYDLVTIVVLCMLFIYIITYHIKKKEIKYKTKILIFYMISIICFIQLLHSLKMIGMAYIALSIYGFFAYLLTCKRNKLVFYNIYVPGIFLSLAWKFCSNTGITTMTIGFVLSAIASVIFLYDFIYEIKENRDEYEKGIPSIFRVISFGLIICSIIITLYLRVVYVHRDAPINLLNKEIIYGPAKGLITTEENFSNYNSIISALDIINSVYNEDKHIFISKLLPWGYIYSNQKVGAYSTWRIPMDSKLGIEYYKNNPEMSPDIVLVLKEDYGVTNDNNSLEGSLAEYLKLDAFVRYDVECGYIFVK